MSQNLQFKAEPTDQGARLDKFLAKKMPDYSRAILQKVVKDIIYTLDNPFTI